MNSEKQITQMGISLRGVSFVCERQTILQDVNFDAPLGRIAVLFGPSGAGKTSCLRLIAGLDVPTKGEILIQDQIVSSSECYVPPRRRRVGFCFQDDALWSALTVREHLTIILQSQNKDKTWIHLQAQELLQRFGIHHLADRMPENLSGGEKKRLALARALASNPKVLLLDEPLSSLDGPARNDLLVYLKTCRRDDRSVLLVTHQLDEAFALGDDLVLIASGRVLQQGAIRDVVERPQCRRAASLLGYRNIFPVTVKNGRANSIFGCWPIGSDLRRPVAAASYSQDFIAVPDSSGSAVVESCWPKTRRFHVNVRYNNEIYEAVSDGPLSIGRSVQIRLERTPVFFEDRE